MPIILFIEEVSCQKRFIDKFYTQTGKYTILRNLLILKNNNLKSKKKGIYRIKRFLLKDTLKESAKITI